MISIKKYLETDRPGLVLERDAPAEDIVSAAVSAYGSALSEISSYSLLACPALGDRLSLDLKQLKRKLGGDLSSGMLQAVERDVQKKLQNWGQRTAAHSKQQADEVKEMLITMARTAEAVGERDQRCASQIDTVTTRLKEIASLDDLTKIRTQIESSAQELKTSIERMAAEGKAAMDQLHVEIASFQTKLEEAQQVASVDGLTGLRSRRSVETHLEQRIVAQAKFCAAIVDIDDFKKVNDTHGHPAGDELLQQFADELKSQCRSRDVIGRWGGDEFVILMDCSLADAETQAARLTQWICGNYTVDGLSGPVKLAVSASLGLAEYEPGDAQKDLIARADAAMYKNKAAQHAGKS